MLEKYLLRDSSLASVFLLSNLASVIEGSCMARWNQIASSLVYGNLCSVISHAQRTSHFMHQAFSDCCLLHFLLAGLVTLLVYLSSFHQKFLDYTTYFCAQSITLFLFLSVNLPIE